MSTYLIHHGILGQRWGVRRFQNADGSLTKAGKKRYAKETMKKLKSDAGQKQRIALDMGTAAVGLGGLYYELTGDKKKKEEYYEEHRKALEEGRLVVKALFKEDYSDGSVTGSVDGVPISKIKIDADGNLINEMFDEDILYAQADFLNYIQNYEANKNKPKEEDDFEFLDPDFVKSHSRQANQGKLTESQSKTLSQIKSFKPDTAKKYKTEDEALEAFNKQWGEKFPDVNLWDNQQLMDAYDDAMFEFFKETVK